MTLHLRHKQAWGKHYWSADAATWFRTRQAARDFAEPFYKGEIVTEYGNGSLYEWPNGNTSRFYPNPKEA